VRVLFVRGRPGWVSGRSGKGGDDVVAAGAEAGVVGIGANVRQYFPAALAGEALARFYKECSPWFEEYAANVEDFGQGVGVGGAQGEGGGVEGDLGFEGFGKGFLLSECFQATVDLIAQGKDGVPVEWRSRKGIAKGCGEVFEVDAFA